MTGVVNVRRRRSPFLQTIVASTIMAIWMLDPRYPANPCRPRPTYPVWPGTGRILHRPRSRGRTRNHLHQGQQFRRVVEVSGEHSFSMSKALADRGRAERASVGGEDRFRWRLSIQLPEERALPFKVLGYGLDDKPGFGDNPRSSTTSTRSRRDHVLRAERRLGEPAQNGPARDFAAARASGAESKTLTHQPPLLKNAAMPQPMVPAPTTTAFLSPMLDHRKRTDH